MGGAREAGDGDDVDFRGSPKQGASAATAPEETVRRAEEQGAGFKTGAEAGEGRGLPEGAPSAPCLGGPIEAGKEGSLETQPSSPILDYSSYTNAIEGRRQFKEFSFVKEIPQHCGALVRRWAWSRPSPTRHYIQGPEEGSEHLPLSHYYNHTAAPEAGTPATGQDNWTPIDDWEFPPLLNTPCKAAVSSGRPPMGSPWPHLNMWCKSCDSNMVCTGKREASGMCQSCLDKDTAKAVAERQKTGTGPLLTHLTYPSGAQHLTGAGLGSLKWVGVEAGGVEGHRGGRPVRQRWRRQHTRPLATRELRLAS